MRESPPGIGSGDPGHAIVAGLAAVGRAAVGAGGGLTIGRLLLPPSLLAVAQREVR